MGASLKPILVVDDDPAMRVALTESLRGLGYATQTATSAEEALTYLNEKQIGVVLTDMKMGGMTGMDLFHNVSKRQPQIPVIIMSAHGTIDTAVMAVKSGVIDYLVKPFSQERLHEVIKKSFSSSPAERSATAIKDPPRSGQRMILTKDPGMMKLLKMAEVVASSDATLFIQGESGTGKELLARFVHEHSPRAHRPFIAINCAAVPENLLESELFGYEKGAFTGAVVRKPGKFELAHTGTILLDEVSEMPLLLQAKLLRVLQEKEVDSVGGKEPIPLDIRVIATTNRPILKEVEAGRFREDLYYRLNVFPLQIPPLRSRTMDIPILAEYFVKKAASRNNKGPITISQDTLVHLTTRAWRGNVREMENTLERATLLAESGVILPEHLGDNISPVLPVIDRSPEGNDGGVKREGAENIGRGSRVIASTGPIEGATPTLWEAERNLILGTLEKMGGNRTHAAKRLGISIRTLRNKLREYRSSSVQDGMGLEEDEDGDEAEGDAVGQSFPVARCVNGG